MAVKIVVSNVCPGATILDSDGTTSFSVASGGNGTCTPAVVKSGIAYQRDYQSRQLISLALYDDAWQYNNGSYNYTAVPNPLYTQEIDWATDSTGWTLKYNNAFGNLNRYTNATGGAPIEQYNLNYSVDNFTGLGHIWSASNAIIKSWDTFYGSGGFLEGYNNTSLLSYNDWFGLNAKMASTLHRYDPIKQNVPYIRTAQRSLLTSTSYNTTRAFYWHPTLGVYFNGVKSSALSNVLTRIHFK